jgi:hypothetical protein
VSFSVFPLFVESRKVSDTGQPKVRLVCSIGDKAGITFACAPPPTNPARDTPPRKVKPFAVPYGSFDLSVLAIGQPVPAFPEAH